MTSMTYLLLLSTLTASAAEVLDVDAVTGLAERRALDASDAELSLLQQEIALHQARLAWTPTVSLRLGSQGSLGRTFSEQLGANVTQPIASLSTSLSASMPLYQGGALVADRRAAAASTDAARHTREQTLQDLRWTAVDGLLAVGQAQDALAVQQAALSADMALWDQVKLQVEAGSASPADRYAQEAVVAARRSAVAAAAQSQRNAELSLLTLLRLDPTQAWAFGPPDEVRAVAYEGDGVALTDVALGQRSDLRAASERIVAAQQAERSARAAYMPSVSLGAGASTSWLSTRDATWATQLQDQARAWVSLDVSVPILNRGVRRGQVQSASVSVRAAEVASQRLQDQVQLDVHRLIAAEAAAEASVASSAASVEAAREAARVRELRYSTGAETLVAVTSARADLVDAELELSRATASLQRVRYEMWWTLGDA